LFVVFGVCWVGGGAQPGIQWQRSYGGSLNDEATEVVQTNDGGYIVSGTTVSDDGDVGTNNGFNEFWVLKLDSLGLVQWKNTYGGSNHDDALALESTMDGGYIMAGFTMSNDGDVSGNHGDFDAWVLKLDSLGTIQWQKCLGGSGWEEAWDIKQTPDGGFIVVGRAGSVDGDVTINHGFLDYWVVKLNVLGAIEWQKSLGGSGLDLGYAVDVTSDGGFIVAGESQSEDGNVTKNSGSSDYWVVKLDIEGKIEWEKSYGGSLLDRANDIKQTRDGGYMVFGQSASNDGDVTNAHGNYDNWLVKLSETGEIEWQKTLGGSSEDYAKSFEQLEDGGYVTLGTSMSTNGDVLGNNGIMDIWVVRLSELGDIQWQKTLGGTKTEWGNAIQQTEDDGFILAGYNWSINGDASTCNGKSDYWIVKLAPESSPTTQPTTQPLNLYPNPATQAITIQIPDTESTLNIQITDLIGRELGRQTIPNGGTVDIKSLPNGVYLVSARTESGEVFLGRVCKQE
jgi:hypothetical protein